MPACRFDGVLIARLAGKELNNDTIAPRKGGLENKEKQGEYTYGRRAVGDVCTRNLLSDEGSG